MIQFVVILSAMTTVAYLALSFLSFSVVALLFAFGLITLFKRPSLDKLPGGVRLHGFHVLWLIPFRSVSGDAGQTNRRLSAISDSPNGTIFWYLWYLYSSVDRQINRPTDSGNYPWFTIVFVLFISSLFEIGISYKSRLLGRFPYFDCDMSNKRQDISLSLTSGVSIIFFDDQSRVEFHKLKHRVGVWAFRCDSEISGAWRNADDVRVKALTTIVRLVYSLWLACVLTKEMCVLRISKIMKKRREGERERKGKQKQKQKPKNKKQNNNGTIPVCIYRNLCFTYSIEIC